MVDVVLVQPLPIDDPEAPTCVAIGYYRNFGVRAGADQVPLLLEQAVRDGRIDWDDTEWRAGWPLPCPRSEHAECAECQRAVIGFWLAGPAENGPKME